MFNKVLEVCNRIMYDSSILLHVKFLTSDLKTLAKLEERIGVKYILGSILACCPLKILRELFWKSPKDSTCPCLEDWIIAKLFHRKDFGDILQNTMFNVYSFPKHFWFCVQFGVLLSPSGVFSFCIFNPIFCIWDFH